MSLKLKPPYVDNTVPVYKVPMEKGVYGKANNDRHSNAGFNISVNQNINDTPTFLKVVEHEAHHIDQMARGDMDYDDNYVYWKGQKIPRANMPEGAHDLPWEEEVYEENPVNMKLRNGSGNHPAFANLSQRDLIKSSPATMRSPLHQDPPKGSEIPYEGSKKAQQQKAELEKLGPEKQVELSPTDPGYDDPDLGIKKHTSFYKAPTEELKKKGNEYWASLSESEKQAIRDKKSRYTKGKIEITPRKAQLIVQDIPTPKPIKTPRKPDIDIPDPGDRNRIKSKKEIKRETLSQFAGTYNKRGKPVMSKSAQEHYDQQLALRKEQKHAARKNKKFLSRDKSIKDQTDYNLPGVVKKTSRTIKLNV